MRTKNWIYAVICFIFMYGCYDDKGNYDYGDINVITVEKYLTNADPRFYKGDMAEITPVLKFSLDEEITTLKFRWELRTSEKEYKTLGHEKVLNWEVDTAGWLQFVLTITDTTNGLQCVDLTRQYVMDNLAYPSGVWLVLDEKDNGAELAMLDLDRRLDEATQEYVTYLDVYADLYTLENDGQRLGGKPYFLQEVFADWDSPSHVLILQEGGIGPVYVDGSSYKKTISLGEEFTGGALPAGQVFVGAAYHHKGDILMSKTGDIFVRRKTDEEVFYSGMYPDFPAYYEKGLEVTLMCKTRSGISTLVYDNKNHRFLAVNDGNVYYDDEIGEWVTDPNTAAILPVFPERMEGVTPLNNMGNVEMYFCDGYTDGDRKFWCVFKNREDGVYYMQFFYYDEWNGYKVIPQYELPFPHQDLLDGTNKFELTTDSREFLFFTSNGTSVAGAPHDKLYAYQHARGRGDAKLLYDFQGRGIVSMLASQRNNAGGYLVVGLDSGEVYFFAAGTTSIFAGGTIEYAYKTEPVFGRIADIKYRFGGQGSIVD
ncbi:MULTISPECIES: PKD-like family lipoprotein [Butyricimonas]|uniref:PKD-like family lipoprotein n=1 Tax=Butyricimonas TaxID=574697 RepID=UPI001D05FFC1|nr:MULTISPECIES: PKD-like family lipoprotein [Butyricimonas]MCB6970997.1 hypothetical protein [Butyricimonas synergistica]MCG4517711.1 PKD-like family lipoprotein [Butyricimonas sp. DFI.6.44]